MTRYLYILQNDHVFDIFVHKDARFKDAPTDFYGRILYLAYQKYVTPSNYYCIGSQLRVKVQACFYNFFDPKCTKSYQFQQVQQMSLEFIDAFRNYAFFSFNWESKLTHNDMTNAILLDDIQEEYIQNLLQRNVRKDTFVILMSDHGRRVGSFRETLMGTIEDRLPYLFIVPPEDFETK